MLILLLPALVFLFIVGWSLYWMGQENKREDKKASASPKKDPVSFMPIIFEESEELKPIK